jgi:hypothetical protein
MTYIDGINAEALDQFLGALESGKYKQGTHRLHTREDNSMCCLGVATAELGPQCGVQLTDSREYSELARHYEDADGKFFYLLMPPSVTELMGIPEQFIDSTTSGDVILVDVLPEDEEWDLDPYVRDDRELVAVSTLNDQGIPFSTIARRIRETLSVQDES